MCLIILARTDPADHAAKYNLICSGALLVKARDVLAGLWAVLEGRAGKEGVAIRHFDMPAQLTSHWRRQVYALASHCCRCTFWSGGGVVAAESDG